MKPIVRISVVVGLLVALASVCEAQDDESERRTATVDLPNAERSRFFWHLPHDKTDELFQGHLALHSVWLGSMQTAYDEAAQQGADLAANPASTISDGANWLLAFSMITDVRQLLEKSAPVRTPSYMPRLRVWRVATAPIPRAMDPDAAHGTRQWVIDGTFGHYSNGQEGCLLVDQKEVDGECEPPPTNRSEWVVNQRNGSFSSHYVELGATYRRLWWHNDAGNAARLRMAQNVSVGARYRNYWALAWLGGGMSGTLRTLYGTHRTRLTAEYVSDQTATGRGAPWWVTAWYEHSSGMDQAVKNGALHGRVSAEVGKAWDRLAGVGFFLRYYKGHDDYNVKFPTALHGVQLGMTLGGERRPTFAEPSQEPPPVASK